MASRRPSPMKLMHTSIKVRMVAGARKVQGNEVAIAWPWEGEVILSDKDRVAPRLKDMPAASF